MARSRLIKPGFFENEKLAELPPLTRLLFAGLWCIADRKGRLEDRPTRIKAQVLAYDKANVDSMLAALAEAGFIDRYQVQGARYIQVRAFLRHQSPNQREAPSIIPAPDEHSTSTVQDTDAHEPSQTVPIPIPITVPIPVPLPVAVCAPSAQQPQKGERSRESDPEFATAIRALENLGITLTPTLGELVSDRLDRGVKAAWIATACGIAASNNARSANYVWRILDGWGADGPPKEQRNGVSRTSTSRPDYGPEGSPATQEIERQLRAAGKL